MRQKEKQR